MAIRNIGGGPPPRVGQSTASEVPATKPEAASASDVPAANKAATSEFNAATKVAAKSTLGLPVATTVMDPARLLAGARGAQIASRLATLWRRRPGERRIPKGVTQSLLAELPTAPWEADRQTTEEDVADYLSKKNKHAEAKQLHAGLSGAQVFDVKGDAEQSGIFKIFGAPEEMLQDIAGLEVIASLGRNVLSSVGVKQAGKNRDGSKSYLLMEKAKGTVLFDRLDAVAAATGSTRAALLKTVCQELSAAGRALGGFHQAAQSTEAVPLEFKHAAANRTFGLFDAARAGAGTGGLADPRLQQQIETQLRSLTREFMGARLQATVALGDIHPGNIAVDGGKCTVFDVNTLVSSLGARGEGLAPSADDRTWFAESLPWYGAKIGLTPAEAALARKHFLDSYRSVCSFATGADDAVAENFYRVRSAMTDLRFAPNSQQNLRAVVCLLGLH